MWAVESLRNEVTALRADGRRCDSRPHRVFGREVAGWSLGGKPQSNRPMRLPRQVRSLDGRTGHAPRLIEA